MIDCTRCGKENQEHYRFCLSCGAELARSPREAGKRLVAPTPPGGVPAVRRSSQPPLGDGKAQKVNVPRPSPLPLTAPPSSAASASAAVAPAAASPVVAAASPATQS